MKAPLPVSYASSSILQQNSAWKWLFAVHVSESILERLTSVQIDFEQLAMRMGSKGGLSARSSWSAVKKKLLDADPHGDFSEVTHGKPRTPRKTAKKAGGEEAAAPTPEGHDGAVGDDGPVTPTLKADAEANAGMDTPGKANTSASLF